jgi:hypothetical protein
MESDKNLIVKKSKFKGAGKGLFAGKDFNKFEKLGEYIGIKLNEKQRDKLKDDSYVWVLSGKYKGFYIDGKSYKKNNKMRFVNGCKGKSQQLKVNVDAYQYRGKVFYKTIKKVKKGTEFIIDYGDDFFDDDDDDDDDDIDYYYNQLKNYKTKTKIQKSVVSTILWCIDFFKNKRHFNSQSPNWVAFLQGLICIRPKSKFSKILIGLLKNELEFMSNNLKIIFKNDGEELMPIFYSLKYVGVSKKCFNKFKKYYNNLSKSDREIYEGDKSFKKSVKKDDFDSLSSEAINYVFLRLSKSNNKGIKFPKDYLNIYMKAMTNQNIKKIEQKKNVDINDLDYHITHLIFIYNSYSCGKYKKKSRLIKEAEDYLIRNSNRILKKSKDIDLIGETLDCMIVLKNKTWLKKNKARFINHILKKKKKNGSYNRNPKGDLYDRFHGAWACVGALYHFF